MLSTVRTWTHLGQILKQRREQLRMTQQDVADAGDISLAIVQMLEGGRKESYRGTTLAALSTALRWEHDAITRLLNGADPDELPTVDYPTEMTEGEKLDQVTETLIVLVDEIRLLRADLAMRSDRNVEN